jgi:hypothetical protein
MNTFACGKRALASSAWRGNNSRSRAPQAIVTGTSSGMLLVKGTAAARISSIARVAARKPAMSPLACSALTLDGLVTSKA